MKEGRRRWRLATGMGIDTAQEQHVDATTQHVVSVEKLGAWPDNQCLKLESTVV